LRRPPLLCWKECDGDDVVGQRVRGGGGSSDGAAGGECEGPLP